MITSCTKCDICRNNNHKPIWGDGFSNARIMFIGKNPTFKDVKYNVPLINNHGMLFQRYLDLFNISREEIYITDAVKCRTDLNRYPSPIEIHNCRPHLESEIESVNPKIIVLLGTTALRSYFKIEHITLPFNPSILINKYLIHNSRIILFAHHPSYIYKYDKGKMDMYNTFIKLISFIRVYKPYHSTNVGI